MAGDGRHELRLNLWLMSAVAMKKEGCCARAGASRVHGRGRVQPRVCFDSFDGADVARESVFSDGGVPGAWCWCWFVCLVSLLMHMRVLTCAVVTCHVSNDAVVSPELLNGGARVAIFRFRLALRIRDRLGHRLPVLRLVGVLPHRHGE